MGRRFIFSARGQSVDRSRECGNFGAFYRLGRGESESYLFPGQRSGTHLTRQAIAYAMRKWGKLVEVELHSHKAAA